MKKIEKKSQVILITITSLIISLGIIYISFIPIIKTARSINEMTNYYQALEISNTGLEIEYLATLTSGFDYLAATKSRAGNNCNVYSRNSNCGYSSDYSASSLNGISKYCDYNSSWRNNGGYLNLERKELGTTTIGLSGYNLTYVKLLINSQGIFKNKLSSLNVIIYPAPCM
ncbi:MAG: hypothetical protein KatS3mg094_472 [Candidatus Parcubacteria bacterium]|nr:MAG: hypothetical protein KatS3mg094_472 [Candidatus Parcubacteria bacterium]